MTSTEARHRRAHKRLKRKAQRAAAWTALYICEVVAAAIPAVIAAAILLPMAYSERGYFSVGGEWVMILLLFWSAFDIINRWICKKIYGEEA